jgi:hypothetical protein
MPILIPSNMPMHADNREENWVHARKSGMGPYGRLRGMELGVVAKVRLHSALFNRYRRFWFWFCNPTAQLAAMMLSKI